MNYYVFHDVDASSMITGMNGSQFNPMTVAAFVAANPQYSLQTTDSSCTCGSPETWLTLATPTSGSYSISTTTTGPVVGVVYGPIPLPPRK